MITLELQYAVSNIALPSESQFQQWTQAITAANGVTQIVALRIIDEDEMSALNLQYRQKTGTTNVLSFPAELHEVVDIPFLGDVVICAPVVISEAEEQGKSEESHWAHMLVHGILHLQGYDHINEGGAKQMEALEVQIMQKLGFDNPYHI